INKFLRGGAASGATGGADSRSVTLQTTNLPSHGHGATGLTLPGFSLSGLSLNGLSVNTGGGHIHSGSGTISSSGGHGHSGTGSTSDGSGGHEHNISGSTTDTGAHTHSYNTKTGDAVYGTRDNAGNCWVGDLSFVILGFFFLYFLRPNILNVGEYLRIKWPDALVSGFFGLILTPLIFAALLGTVLGIFLAPVFTALYVFFLFFAFYSAAMLLGETTVKIFTYRDHIYLEMLLGVSVLFFCPFIPYLGQPLFFILLLFGMGGAINQRFGAE
ncbi:hypothetical protein NO1_1840, partial [Candidatus Termititenax aidoneus]